MPVRGQPLRVFATARSTLGYGVTYALGNVLLAFWGTVIVLLMT